MLMNSETNIHHDQNRSNSAWKSEIARKLCQFAERYRYICPRLPKILVHSLILRVFLIQFDLLIFFNLVAKNTGTCENPG